MTLMAPRLVDELLGKKKGDLVYLPGAKDRAVAIANLICGAEKIDFGELYLEKLPNSDVYGVPKLTQEENEFWEEGLIPPPSKVSWLEFSINGFRSGLLVTGAKKSDWRVMRVDYDTGGAVFDGLWAVSGERDDGLSLVLSGGDTVSLTGNREALDLLRRGLTSDVLMSNYFSNFGLSAYLCLMLNSKSTEVKVSEPDEKLNRARVKRGATPLPSHRVVNITPGLRGNSTGDGDGDRRAPRLHWRRSHVRRYRGENGEVVKRVVIPRCLVGRAESGVVTHEYRVR